MKEFEGSNPEYEINWSNNSLRRDFTAHIEAKCGFAQPVYLDNKRCEYARNSSQDTGDHYQITEIPLITHIIIS